MSNKEIKKEDGATPREAVVLFIYNDKGETLFTKRSKNRRFLPGVWALPAGHMEKGENFEDTVKREAQEELAIDVHTVGLDEVIHEPSGDNTQIHLLSIFADSYTGTPTINTDEFETIMWMKVPEFYAKFKDEEIGSTLRYLRPRFEGTKNTN